jgi:hypothetical protein
LAHILKLAHIAVLRQQLTGCQCPDAADALQQVALALQGGRLVKVLLKALLDALNLLCKQGDLGLPVADAQSNVALLRVARRMGW